MAQQLHLAVCLIMGDVVFCKFWKCAFFILFLSLISCHRNKSVHFDALVQKPIPIIYEMTGIGNATGRIVTDSQIYSVEDLKKISAYETLHLYLTKGKKISAYQDAQLSELLNEGDPEDKINVFVTTKESDENYYLSTLLNIAQKDRLNLYIQNRFYSIEDLALLLLNGTNLFFLTEEYTFLDLKKLSRDSSSKQGTVTFYLKTPFLKVGEIIELIEKNGVVFKCYQTDYAEKDIVEIALTALRKQVLFTLFVTEPLKASSQETLFSYILYDYLGVELQFLYPLFSPNEFNILLENIKYEQAFLMSYMASLINNSLYLRPMTQAWLDLLKQSASSRKMVFFISPQFDSRSFDFHFWEHMLQFGAKLVFLNAPFTKDQYQEILTHQELHDLDVVHQQQPVEMIFSDIFFSSPKPLLSIQELKDLSQNVFGEKRKNLKLVLALGSVSSEPETYDYGELIELAQVYGNQFFAFLPNNLNSQKTLNFNEIQKITALKSAVFTYESNIKFEENIEISSVNGLSIPFTIKNEEPSATLFIFWNGSFVNSLQYNFTPLSYILEKYKIELMMSDEKMDLNFYHPQGLKSISEMLTLLDKDPRSRKLLSSIYGANFFLFYKDEKITNVAINNAIASHGHLADGTIAMQFVYSYYQNVFIDPATVMHEIAHCVDVHYSGTPQWGSDGLRTKLFTGGSGTGFLREYARANGGEDFAVHVEEYVRHGWNFRAQAQFDAKLKLKYEFIKDHIFEGLEF